MKKIAVILLTFLYLLPAIGFSIDTHWCGNKLQMVKFNSITKKECLCGKKMPKGCCRRIHQVIKLTDNQNAASILITPNSGSKQLANLSIVNIASFCTQVKTFDFISDHAPPGKSKRPVYLTNCTFRI